MTEERDLVIEEVEGHICRLHLQMEGRIQVDRGPAGVIGRELSEGGGGPQMRGRFCRRRCMNLFLLWNLEVFRDGRLRCAYIDLRER